MVEGLPSYRWEASYKQWKLPPEFEEEVARQPNQAKPFLLSLTFLSPFLSGRSWGWKQRVKHGWRMEDEEQYENRQWTKKGMLRLLSAPPPQR